MSSMKWISLGQILNFSKIGLGQLYKKNKFFKNWPGTTLQKINKFLKNRSRTTFKKKNYHSLEYPYFKICNYKKGTM